MTNTNTHDPVSAIARAAQADTEAQRQLRLQYREYVRRAFEGRREDDDDRRALDFVRDLAITPADVESDLETLKRRSELEAQASGFDALADDAERTKLRAELAEIERQRVAAQERSGAIWNRLEAIGTATLQARSTRGAISDLERGARRLFSPYWLDEGTGARIARGH
jgi:hypothetical protein